VFEDSRRILSVFSAEDSPQRLSSVLEDFLLEEFPLDRVSLFWKSARHRHFHTVSGVLNLAVEEARVVEHLPEFKRRDSGEVRLGEIECSYLYVHTPTQMEAVLCYHASEEPDVIRLSYVLETWLLCRERLMLKNDGESVTQKLSKIRTVSRELGRAQDLKNVLSKILKMTISLVEAQKGFIMLQSATDNMLHLEVVHGLENPHAEKLINEGKLPTEGVAPGKGVQGKVFQTRKPMIVDEITDFRAMGLDRDTHSILCVPLVANDETIGVIYVTNKRDFTRFEPVDLDLITILASNVASVVDQARLYKKAVTDHLTGLFTRRFMDNKIASEIKRSRRFSHPLCVLMIDADHFKDVNDTWGHEAGDAVLQVIAEVLNSSIRLGVDVNARMGGEEFCVLLPETPVQGAVVVAERIRKMMEGRPVPYDDKQIKVTLSIGIADMDLSGNVQETYKDLLRKADEALYISKEEGRNRVSIWRPG